MKEQNSEYGQHPLTTQGYKALKQRLVENSKHLHGFVPDHSSIPDDDEKFAIPQFIQMLANAKGYYVGLKKM